MEILIRNQKYKVIKDYGDTVTSCNFDEIVTEYYNDFDYIVGDWAYGKVRLKGFYNKNNNAVKNYNKSIKSFPKNILAGMFGFEKKEYFEAKESSNEVPEVSFE